MSRFPALVIAALAAATIGAFFVVQHLKVTTPLIAAPSPPNPAAINPIAGRVCAGVDHRLTYVTFYLKHRSDSVDVYVLDQSGTPVATIASGRYMPGGANPKREKFIWNGFEDDGQAALDGIYTIEVDLIHQGRTVRLTPDGGTTPFEIKVETHAPQPRILSVVPQTVPRAGALGVRIRYSGTEGHPGTVLVYRTDVPGRPQLVHSFLTPPSGAGTWDGRIGGRPAPAGTYLVALSVTDAACNTGLYPQSIPPPAGSASRTGVSVRYLTALASLAPQIRTAQVTVSADGRGWRYAVRPPGRARKAVAAGTVPAGGPSTRTITGLPRAAGLYTLSVRSSGGHHTIVPLLTASDQPEPVLVVLPAITWEGLDPVDDTGDGLPDTLDRGGPAGLARPLVDGLPSGFGEEAALLAHLQRTHVKFDLTTDLALSEGAGPTLAGHRLVILPGSERWINRKLAQALLGYLRSGGSVLSLGLQSLRSYVVIRGSEASSPTGLGSVDIFGVRHAPYVPRGAGVIGELSDTAGLFGDWSGVLNGFSAYEPITGVTGSDRVVASAGVTASSLVLAAVQIGQGMVVELSLPEFVASLRTNPDAAPLLDGVVGALARRGA